MQVTFLKKFSKDLDKINRTKDKKAILEVIQQIKQADKIEYVAGVKKLRGFNDAFRIRSGNYRIGVFVDNDTVHFARIAHRKEIYKIFP